MSDLQKDYKSKYQRSKLLIIVLVSVIFGIIIGGAFSFVMFGDIDSIKTETVNANDTNAPTDEEMNDEIEKKMENREEHISPVVDVAEKLLPSIVMIKNKVTLNSPLRYGNGAGGQSIDQGTGSGIIYKEDGYIITNQHVIDGASEIEVVLHDGRVFDARILGEDSKSDIAVLKIEASNLAVAEFGDSDNIKVGELAVAIGTPAGEEFSGSVTAGIISALNRSIDMGEKRLKLIQTDAAINPGNSGGALVNKNGEVIGINSVKLSAPDIEGMGFAIPTNDAIPLVEELIKHGYIQRPWIGVMISTITEEMSKTNTLPKGVYIGRVYYDSPAEKSGLQAGDIITEIDGTIIETTDDLSVTIEKYKPEDVIELKIYRDKEYKKIKVKLGVMRPE